MSEIAFVDDHGLETIKKSGLVPNDSSPTQYALRTYPITGLVPKQFDYIALTYVSEGNGVGEIETVTFKSGGASGTAVAVLTLAYNAGGNLTSVTKS